MTSSLYGTRIPPQRYNHFFNPNLCHVCKYKNQKYLKLCSDCYMITYCSEEHRLQHQPQHKEICDAINRMSRMKDIWLTRGMNDDEWVKHKKENLQDIQKIICRTLEPYEQQMFLLAKSCGICHEQRDIKFVCPGCSSINLCDDHRHSSATHSCMELKKSLLLDIYEFLEKKDVRIPLINLPNTMIDIVESGSTKVIVDRFMKKLSLGLRWKIVDFINSNAISGPLTVIYAIHRINPLPFLKEKQTHVLHIIAGSLTDKQSLSAWEMALHVVLPTKKILITMVELGLKIDEEDIGEWDVCGACDAMKKTLTFQVHDMSYESYVQCSSYEPPDVVIGFNVEVQELGKDTIKILQRQECPVLLTTISVDKLNENIIDMDEILGIRPEYIANANNKFQSHRPYRDLQEDTFFPNRSILFYLGLNEG